MPESEQTRGGPSPVAAAPAGGRADATSQDPRPAAPSTLRTIIGVGPGARPAARLSTIAPGAGRPAAPRSVPSQAPRPMHPPIRRVAAFPRISSSVLQAAALASRPGTATPAGRRGVAGAMGGPAATPNAAAPRTGFGMPSLRRNICPHFFMSGARGAMPIQAPHLLKALVRQETNVSRCQLRGGVHLEGGYVNDVCLAARFNQCVFYEDELTR